MDYLAPCQILIDKILFYQRIKERGLYNVSNLFVNLSAKQLDKAIGNKRKRLTAITILKDLQIISVNENYAFKDNNTLGKSFSKSYRINPEYYSDIISYQGDPLIQSNTLNINNYLGLLICSCGSPSEMYVHQSHNRLNIPCDCNNITRSNQTNWIYSPATRLRKSQRKTLINEKGLIEVDIASAHLQYLIRVINDLQSTGDVNTLFDNQIDLEAFKSEFAHFRFYVYQYKFYDHFEKKFQLECWKKTTENDRKKTKTVVMSWLASGNNRLNVVKLLKTFYPMLTRLFKYVNGNGTKTLLVKLMQMEAQTVNPVTEYMAMHHPESICISIFDGFIVERQYADLVTNLLFDHGSKILGFDLKVKVDGLLFEKKNLLLDC